MRCRVALPRAPRSRRNPSTSPMFALEGSGARPPGGERIVMARHATASPVSAERDRMVDLQIAGRGITDPRVLAAMRKVPRDAFVPPGFEEFAYTDGPLPIAHGQTISQPYIVALMIEAAAVKHGDRVLGIATGCGYAAAVLAEI